MKKITLILFSVFILFSLGFAQNKIEYDYLVNLNGEVWIKRYENLQEVESKELSLENGYHIFPGGLIVEPNGNKVKLKPGEKMDLNGSNVGKIEKADMDNIMADFHSQNFNNYKELMKNDLQQNQHFSDLESQNEITEERLYLLEQKSALTDQKSKLLGNLVFTEERLKKGDKEVLRNKYNELDEKIQSINEKLDAFNSQHARTGKGEE